MEKILVAGSAGKPGAEIIKVLRQHEYPTRALVRDPLRLALKPTELFFADEHEPVYVIAPQVGTRKLKDYFAKLVQRSAF
jgi:uncharacterized protein YbjT (DUF2867 family)